MTPAQTKSNVVPLGAWIVATVVFLAAALCMFAFVGMSYWPIPNLLFPLLTGLLAGAYAIAAGYVYGDARRRGMRYVMWTLLVIFIPNAIGFILYFMMREPMPVYCPRCGRGMNPGFAFCPTCGNNVAPGCGSCGKRLEAGWTHCAWCGVKAQA